jgi:hypothetical protein
MIAREPAGHMSREAIARALETSVAITRVKRAVAREGSERVALNRTMLRLNRTKLRESAERLAATKQRWLIRKMLWRGDLPYERPAVVCGGPGDGETCAVCGKSASRTQLVMAIPDAGGATVLHLDADCFQLWDLLRHPAPRI